MQGDHQISPFVTGRCKFNSNLGQGRSDLCPGAQVITKTVGGKLCEPFEDAVVEVPDEFVGAVTTLLGSRKGVMEDMRPIGESSRVTFRIPTRCSLFSGRYK